VSGSRYPRGALIEDDDDEASLDSDDPLFDIEYQVRSNQDASLAGNTNTGDQESMGKDRPIAIGGTELGQCGSHDRYVLLVGAESI